MKIFVLLYLAFFPRFLHAQLSGSFGLEIANAHSSENKNNQGRPYVGKAGFLGLRGDLDFKYHFVSAALIAAYSQANSKIQYEYKDESQANVDAKLILLKLMAGLRLNLLDCESLRVFAGSGALMGGLTLSNDKDYLEKGEESQPIGGSYWEMGIDYKVNENYRIMLNYQKASIKSGEYEFLARKEMEFTHSIYTVSVMAPLDF